MMQRVQLSIADSADATALREALSRSCAWQIDLVDRPDLSQPCVLVLDEFAFARLPLPLSHPETLVLICLRIRNCLPKRGRPASFLSYPKTTL